ncbi:MAG: hypothetical protein KDA57_16275 [Planctomycetales bacterium]|nr:hypothetical protein [Planctomycetales bacterium]
MPRERPRSSKQRALCANLAKWQYRPLGFEQLEDRRMLAVIGVDSLLDNFNPAAPTSDGMITLREAILAANTDTATGDAPAGSGLDEIAFAVDGRIQLASQLPTITGDLSIDGGGRPITIAGGSFRLIEIDDGVGGNQITVSLTGLSLTGANTGGSGGAIFNAENLTVTETTIWGNTALVGGGIYNTGTLLLQNLTLSDNQGSINGGGLYSTGSAELESVTVYQNTAGFSGGGIWSTGTLSLGNSAFAANVASSANTRHVFGTATAGSSFNFLDRPDGAAGLMHGVDGNIIGNGSGGFLSSNLSPLDDHGGPVPTRMPLADSPLLDNGDDTVSTATDSRGGPFLRDDGNGVDIGAVERQTLAGLSLVVDTTSDNYDSDINANQLSLREAISLANGSVGAESISFAPLFDTAQTIAVKSEYHVVDDVMIDATGQLVTLDAGGGLTANPGDGHRLFVIDDGVLGTVLEVTLSGLTITGGDPTSSSLLGQGGAIRNMEHLSVQEVTLEENSAADGGGIYSVGELTVVRSTLADNRATNRGGGIYASGIATLDNSTLSANLALNQGGGIYSSFATFDIVSSTLTLNDANNNGGGIFENSSTIAVNSSIVASNTSPSGANVFGALDTNTFNFVGGDPLLNPLAFNGGPTSTHSFSVYSPVINAGDPALSMGTDQRGTGFGRVELGRADIGAYEFQDADLLMDLIVSSTADTLDEDFSAGQFTLREAIYIANTRPGLETIEFDPTLFATQQTIFTSSQLEIDDSLVINGTGRDLLTIDGNLGGDGLKNGNGHLLFRIFPVVLSPISVEFRDLTLQGGDTNSNGGAISSGHDLTLRRVTVANNSGGSVGGVSLNSGTTSTIEDSLFTGNLARSSSIDNSFAGAVRGGNINIVRSTFSNNQSITGAGAVNVVPGSDVLNVSESTFSGNSGLLGAGAIRVRLGSSANVVSSTFSDNAGMGALLFEGATLNLAHSTFVENTNDLTISSGAAHVTHSIVPVLAGTLASNTFNLIGVDAMLGPLVDNGGPTLTHAPLPGSIAIDAGDMAAAPGMNDVPLFDQRGNNYGRVQNGRIDIGAFELRDTPSADFDNDGFITGFDFLSWQRGFGTNAPDAEKADGDADNDTDVDGSDLSIWESQLGTVAPLVVNYATSESFSSTYLATANEAAPKSLAELSVAVTSLGTADLDLRGLFTSSFWQSTDREVKELLSTLSEEIFLTKHDLHELARSAGDAWSDLGERVNGFGEGLHNLVHRRGSHDAHGCDEVDEAFAVIFDSEDWGEV